MPEYSETIQVSPSTSHRGRTMRDLLRAPQEVTESVPPFLSIRDENGIGDVCPTSPLVNAQSLLVFYVGCI